MEISARPAQTAGIGLNKANPIAIAGMTTKVAKKNRSSTPGLASSKRKYGRPVANPSRNAPSGTTMSTRICTTVRINFSMSGSRKTRRLRNLDLCGLPSHLIHTIALAR